MLITVWRALQYTDMNVSFELLNLMKQGSLVTIYYSFKPGLLYYVHCIVSDYYNLNRGTYYTNLWGLLLKWLICSHTHWGGVMTLQLWVDGVRTRSGPPAGWWCQSVRMTLASGCGRDADAGSSGPLFNMHTHSNAFFCLVRLFEITIYFLLSRGCY